MPTEFITAFCVCMRDLTILRLPGVPTLLQHSGLCQVVVQLNTARSVRKQRYINSCPAIKIHNYMITHFDVFYKQTIIQGYHINNDHLFSI